MALETAVLTACEPCLALPHLPEHHAVKKNNEAGGLLTNSQAESFFELSSLQLIVYALNVVGGKKQAETATNRALWDKPNIHAGLAEHESKIRLVFEYLKRMKFQNVNDCLDHIHSSLITNFIKLAAETTSLPTAVRDVYDKVAEQIRKDTVNDNSINSMAKAATYSLELQSMFQSKRINPVVKKPFDPSFKKKHQEE